MDDLPLSGRPPPSQKGEDAQSRDQHSSNPTLEQQSEAQLNMDFQPAAQQQFATTSQPAPGPYDMSSVGAALPEFPMRPYQQPQHQHQHPFPQQFMAPAATNPALLYQYQQQMFSAQAAGNYHQNFATQYNQQYMQAQQHRQQYPTYPHYMANPQGPTGAPNLANQAILLQHPMMHNPVVSPAHLGQPGHFVQQHGSSSYGNAYGNRGLANYPPPQLRVDSGLVQTQSAEFYQPPNTEVRRNSSTSSFQSSVLRGPPRKPRQSGHALWVGNLPPSANIIDLKDHFSKDATEDIESVFLISKSNCAFVNYKTEASCAAAMSRFHDSRFQGVRLVCRLRRGSGPTSTPPPMKPTVEASEAAETDNAEAKGSPAVDGIETPEPAVEATEKVKEKFFIVKSLTMEDLEHSVQSGIWATQAHNEAALNAAYQTAENVYLICSANKSGEYFGYARMESAIDDDSTAGIEYQPRSEAISPSPSDLPLTIPTLPSSTAPKGRIIDDSARGTIFWEAEVDPSTVKDKDDSGQAYEEEGGDISGENEDSTNVSPGTPQTFGKPFKIKWMSTERLPFYRTRGLRNPWNANREVKIARDGTEIEPTVGRRLIGMFHRPQLLNPSPTTTRNPPPPQAGPSSYMPSHSSMPGANYPRHF